jgi:hypothetical protein
MVNSFILFYIQAKTIAKKINLTIPDENRSKYSAYKYRIEKK